MQFTAQQIGTLLNGVIDGNSDVTVDRLAKIEEADAGSLSFLANPKYEPYIYTTNASIVIVGDSFVPTAPVSSTLIRVADPYSAFSVLLDQYNTLQQNRVGVEEPNFVDKQAVIGENHYIGAFSYVSAQVKVGDNCKIYPQVYIGNNVEIGDNCTFFPGVKIYHDCKIGNNVVIHAGTVIGSDGFGFAPQADGSYNKVAQIGNVIIEDNVEIGANTTVDRATMGSTIIRKGVKLDNLIQIAHNVEVGNNTVVAAQTGISGSSKIAEQCILGGQVGVVGHISVAKGSQVQAQSGINRSIELEDKKWAGTPATQFNTQMRAHVVYNRLPDLEKRIAELEKIIQENKNK